MMNEIDVEELLTRLQDEEKEKARQETIASQIRKGCYNCSQWDDYWGCTRVDALISPDCESI